MRKPAKTKGRDARPLQLVVPIHSDPSGHGLALQGDEEDKARALLADAGAAGLGIGERPDRRASGQRDPACSTTLDGDAVMTEVRANGLQTALVVDEYGGTAGLVTQHPHHLNAVTNEVVDCVAHLDGIR